MAVVAAARPQEVRFAVSLCLFRPLVVVDTASEWYAVVSDGTTEYQVMEWPLRDLRFDLDPSAVIHIELYVAEDDEQFLRGQGSRFAEIHVPVSKVKESNGSLFRNWFGLQRGCLHGTVSWDMAAELYEVGMLLSRNLLTPKLCCSVVDAELVEGSDLGKADGVEGCEGLWEGPLRRSLLQHSNIIAHMHHQLRALWAQGQLVCTERPNGDVTAHLGEASGVDGQMSELTEFDGEDSARSSVGHLQAEIARLTDTVAQLTARLEQCDLDVDHHSRLKIRYREELTRLTGKSYDDEEVTLADSDESADVPTLQRKVRNLEESLKVDRKRVERLLQLLQEEGSRRDFDFQNSGVLHGQVDELSKVVQVQVMEIHALRADEQEQRAQLQEMRLENDRVMQRVQRREAEASALREELKERTSRLVQAWSAQAVPVAEERNDKSRDLVRDRVLSSKLPGEVAVLHELGEECSHELRDAHRNMLEQEEMIQSLRGTQEVSVAAQRTAHSELQNALQSEKQAQDMELRAREAETRLLEKVARHEEEMLQMRAVHQHALSEVTTKLETSAKASRESHQEAQEELLAALSSQASTQRAIQDLRRELEEQADGWSRVNHGADGPSEPVRGDLDLKQFEHQLQAELLRMDDAARCREDALLGEIQDLEELNDQLSEQSQKHFDEMALFQDRISLDIVDLRRECEKGNSKDASARWRHEIREYQDELKRVQSRSAEELQAQRTELEILRSEVAQAC